MTLKGADKSTSSRMLKDKKKKSYVGNDKAFYDSAYWRRTRKEVLKENNYECKGYNKICYAMAVEVDHRIPRSENGSDEKHNLDIYCESCHIEKTNADKLRRLQEKEND